MGIELLNPDNLFKPDSYHQVAVATGRRMIFMWGQVSQATNGGLSAQVTWRPRRSRPAATLRQRSRAPGRALRTSSR
ncbi:MAG: hypothetical protein ABIX12_10735 [Rubrivivax sp.]